MNGFTSLRQLGLVLTTLFALARTSGVQAQCTISTASPEPIPITLLLTGGSVTLNTGTVAPAIGFSGPPPLGGGCFLQFSLNPGMAGAAGTINFNCTHVAASPITVYVQTQDVVFPFTNASSPIVELAVTIVDDTPPTITCPANSNTMTDAGLCTDAVPGINATILDNCSVTTLTWTSTGATNTSSPVSGINQASGNVFNKGVSTVTYTATDASGLTATCAFTVTVNDTELPTITCPISPVNVFTNPGVCYATLPMTAPSSLMDNCPGVFYEYSINAGAYASAPAFSTQPFAEGVAYTVNFRAVDAVGNMSAPCAFMVNVTDNQPPSITCPSPLSPISTSTGVDPNDCIGRATINFPAVSDNCGVSTYTYELMGPATFDGPNPIPFGGASIPVDFNLGTTSVTISVVDVNGVSASCPLTITVVDDVKPALTVPPMTQRIFKVPVNASDCNRLINFDRPALAWVSDCGSVTLSQGLPNPMFWNLNPDPNVLVATPPFPPAGGDNVSIQFPVGTTKLVYTYTDNAMPANTDTLVYTFIVTETVLPVAKCVPVGTVVLSLNNIGNGSVTVNPNTINNGSTDNCGIQSYSVAPSTFDCGDLNLGPQSVTLTVTDNSGNVSTCMSDVTLIDNFGPTISCPGTTIIDAGAGCLGSAFDLVGYVVFGDNCYIDETFLEYSLDGGANYSTFTSFGGETFSVGTTPILIRITDSYGNINGCSINVVVEDNDAPTVVPAFPIPSPAPVNTISNGCFAAVTWNEPKFEDNCTPSGSITVFRSHNSGQNFPLGNTVVTYTATDLEGNASTHTFTVTVQDMQNPTALCKPNFSVNLPNGVAPSPTTITVSQINNNSFDNCSVTTAIAPTSVSCANIGAPANITLTATDGSGNTATCVTQVSVLDVSPPVANCNNAIAPLILPAGPNASVSLSAATLNNGSTDNCSITAVQISRTSASTGYSAHNGSVSFTCADIGLNTVWLRVTDGALPTAFTHVCAATVSVVDNMAPSIVAPANTTVQCSQLPYTSPNPTISDNCNTNIAVPTPVTSGPTVLLNCVSKVWFTFTRTWTVTDGNGNTSTTTQMITVVDADVPVLTLNNSYSFDQMTSSCTMDLTSTLSLTSANTSDCSTNFATLLANAKMGINFPGATPDIPNATLYNPANLAAFPIGTSTVTFTLIDNLCNTLTKTITVTVNDKFSPTFNVFPTPHNPLCGRNFVLNNTPGTCANIFTWHRPNISGTFNDVTDCTGIVTITEAITGGAAANINPTVSQFIWNADPNANPANVTPTIQVPVTASPTLFTYVATDGAGNTSSCTFTVKVNDTEAVQTPTCPSTQTLNSICPTAQVPNFTSLVTVMDNCPANITVSQSPIPTAPLSSISGLTLLPGSTFIVTMTATDLGGSSKTCTFNVTLQDGTAPIPTIPGTSLPNVSSNCGFVEILAPTATDACNQNNQLIYGVPSAGQLIAGSNPPKWRFVVGNYTFNWIYNDGNGNLNSQTQTITVTPDVLPPNALCKAGVLVVPLQADGDTTITPIIVNNGSFDQNNCDPNISLSMVGNAKFDCSHLNGNYVVTMRATDNQGNSATCTATVDLIDNTPPTFVNPPANVTLEACKDYPLPAPATITITDNCYPTLAVVYTADTTSTHTSTCRKYDYTITRKWVATDGAGNSSTYTQTIRVDDTKAPDFSTVPNNQVIVTGPGQTACAEQFNFNVRNTISECASGLDLSITPNSGNLSGMYSVGIHNITVTATDACGNSSTRVQTFQVKDETAPTAVCFNAISLTLNQVGSATVTPAMINNPNGTTDNCPAPLTFAVAPNTFGCAQATNQPHLVTLTVTDAAGNTAACQSQVTVLDLVQPTITFCPANVTVACTTDYSPAVLGNATANDNCLATMTITMTESAPNCGVGFCTIIRTWTARDQANNTATCSQSIRLNDSNVPTLSATPANITVACPTDVPAVPNITANDLCDSNVGVVFVADTTYLGTGTCKNYHYQIRRRWTATDDAGNSTGHTQMILVRDDVRPSYGSMPTEVEFLTNSVANNTACNAPVAFNVYDYLTDCTPDNLLNVSASGALFGNGGPNINGLYPVGTTRVIFNATDQCGNARMDTVLIKVKDNTTPQANCKDFFVVSLTSNGTAVITTANINDGSFDNCGLAPNGLSVSPTTFDCGDLGFNSVTLTVTDLSGNINTCTVDVEVQPGVVTAFNLDANSTPTSYFAASDGTATATTSGGSGNFSYLWSTTATTKTITGLPAGLYSVTVTDNTTGCKRVETTTVTDGPKVTFKAGDGIGAQGTMIEIPVTADQFIDLLTFSFTIDVVNPAVATVVDVVSVNPALDVPAQADFQYNLNGNKIGILWANAQSQPVSLPNGTVLFHVKVTLVGPVSSSTPIEITGNPVIIEVNQDGTGTVPADVEHGLIQINNGIQTVELAGDIKTWKNPEVPTSVERPVNNVLVDLVGTQTASLFTAPAGMYDFTVTNGSVTDVSCTKVTPGNGGITGGDLIRIVNHIFGDQFSSPYQWVAADVNNSGTITLADYLRIQRVALGTDLHLQGSPDWKFIPKSYVFPAAPLTAPFPQDIIHNPALQDWLDDDFVAVRMGDVNGNTPVSLKDDADDRNGSTFYLRLDEQTFEKGDLVVVPFKAADFSGKQGYQFTLNFDPAVFALENIQTGQLPLLTMENFGTTRLSEGYLTTVWVSREAVTMPENETLFTLTFRALSNGKSLAQTLRAGSEVTRAEAYERDGNIQNVDFEYVLPIGGGNVDTRPFALYQNQPNPVKGITTIGFRLPEAAPATLRIFNAAGQLVKTIDRPFEKGFNQVNVHTAELGGNGVFWYELETDGFSARKKMIVIE